MAFREYTTRLQMIADGWRFPPRPRRGTCRACGKQIEWITSPRNKDIPLDLGTTRVHVGVCPGKTTGDDTPEPTPSGQLADAVRELANAIRELASALRDDDVKKLEGGTQHT